ncbi:MAG: radical SAM protein [Candidatus Omnitrophica bacterium]|nr:radical SAM protein [Candidatus Omnitrophota bacterium]MBU1925762.1 radical SAM protein [Candidatus Omnitrophota bacterium]
MRKKIFPDHICFEVTHRCTSDCVTCAAFFKRPDTSRRELSIKEIKKIIDEISSYRRKPYISITGGEPFLRSDILDILRYLEFRKVPYGIFTNATAITSGMIKRMKNLNPQRVQISLDGPKEIHDKIRRQPGAYAKTIETIKHIKQETKWKVLLVCVINVLNVRHLTEVAAIANQLGVDLRFEHVGFLTLKRLFQQKEITKHTLKITEASFVWDKNKEWLAMLDAGALYEEMLQIKKGKRKINIYFSPDLTKKKMEEYYSCSDEAVVSDTCYFPWFGAKINPYGDVFVCRGVYLPIGNILNNTLNALYNNKSSNNFRKHLKEKLLPACARCPWCASGDLCGAIL